MVQLDHIWYWPLLVGWAPFWEIGYRLTLYLFQKKTGTEVIIYSNSNAEFRAREIWLTAAYSILSVMDLVMLAQIHPNTMGTFLGTHVENSHLRSLVITCIWFPFAVSYYLWFTYDEYRRKSPPIYTFHHCIGLLAGPFMVYCPAEALMFMIPVDIGDVILHTRSYLKLSNSPLVHQSWMKVALFISLVGKTPICFPLFYHVAQRPMTVYYVVWLLAYSVYAAFAVLWVSKWVCVRKETRLEQQYAKEKYQEQQEEDLEQAGSKRELGEVGSKGELEQVGSKGELELGEKPHENGGKSHENGEKSHQNVKSEGEGIELTILSS